eukprot:5311305-Alexandrium_andersonii.AAC.1
MPARTVPGDPLVEAVVAGCPPQSQPYSGQLPLGMEGLTAAPVAGPSALAGLASPIAPADQQPPAAA